MTKARELAELGKAVSVHDNRLDFDRAVVIPGLIDAAGTTTIADGSITTAKIADDAVTTAKVNPAQTDITSVGTLTSFRSTGIDDNADALAITINNSEHVGIGTASPDGTLHVHSASAGSVTATSDGDDLVVENSGNGGINILTPDANRSALFFGHASDNNKMQIRHDGATSLSQIISDDTLTFNVGGGAERIRIDTSGNVGVGIASPGAKLAVSGLAALVNLGGNVTGSAAIYVNSTSGHTGELIQVLENGTSRMHMTNTGNLGIGTNSPDGTLHVHSGSAGSVTANIEFNDLVIENNNNMGMTFLSPNNTFQQIGFGDPDDNDIGKILYQHTNDSMQFVVNAAERMRINSSGHVAIGTTDFATQNGNVSTILKVGGTNNTIIAGEQTASTRNFILEARYNGRSGGDRYAQMGFGEDGSNNGSINFWTAPSGAGVSERMVITSDGKAGIGTSSPAFKLQVSGTNTQIGIESTTTNQNASLYYTANGAHQWEVGTNVSAGLNYEVYDRVSNTSRFVVTHTPTVGIGTNSPSTILHINSNAPHVRIVNTTNTSYSGGTSKISMDNAAVAAARGMISETLYTWSQTTADSWILVRTPQAYANNEAGGWAEFKLAWTGYHATNNTLMFWTAIFHNNHGRTFSWSKTAVTTIGGGSGSYSPYNYTPAVAFYRQTSAGGGYNSNDSWMRNLYIKVSGNAASSVATKRSLYIKGLSGGFDYEIAHAGTSTPAGGLTSV